MGYAVRFEDVTKRYPRGGPRYPSLRHELAEGARRLGQRLRGERPEPRGILALDRVSFEVEEGEAFAIIGPNGAGKSTALKLVSRISYPTGGRVRLRGRVAALIEVGSGVHPELTGRENIWLYGQILGMDKADIRRRFDEIVDFAELPHALDTPVKMYSTGMQLRLGFAIASHLDPDVFVVDEALAVGDASFQRKCVSKLRDIRQRSTVIFVSHDMTAIRTVCSRGILLLSGHLTADGSVEQVLEAYRGEAEASAIQFPSETDTFVVNEVSVHSGRGPRIRPFDPVTVDVHVRAKQEVRDPAVYLGILTSSGYRVCGLDFKDFSGVGPMQTGEERRFRFHIASLPLVPGSYQLEIHVKDMWYPRVEIVPKLYGMVIDYLPLYGGRRLDGWFGDVCLEASVSSDSCENFKSPGSQAIDPSSSYVKLRGRET